MITLLIIITIVVGVVSCVGILEYSKYKTNEFNYQKGQVDNVTLITELETKIEIERERTKQLSIKADYREKYKTDIPEKDYELEILKEKTKQLEIKERCYKEHGERLYV